jgi:1,4-dihydroxy-2-naphthoate octaprenyltransferase
VAFSCIITGNGLALAEGKFSALVFVLALMTTVLLQILSNLANDYGDYTKGVDNDDRVGPSRSLQSGLINKKEMIHAMWVVSFLLIKPDCNDLDGPTLSSLSTPFV